LQQTTRLNLLRFTNLKGATRWCNVDPHLRTRTRLNVQTTSFAVAIVRVR